MANERSLKESLLAASPFLIKILELVLTIFGLCLIIPPYNNKIQPNTTKAGIIISAFTGSILINILIIVCHFLGERIPKKACLMISGFYGVILIVVSFILIQDWRFIQNNVFLKPLKYHLDMMIASGIFSLLASITFIADVVLMFKFG